MLKARKKITQKEIKKDKLVTAYFETKEMLSKESVKKKIYTGLGILVVIILVIFFYINNKKAKNEEAETKLSGVITLYEAGKYQESINGDPTTNTTGLMEIVNNYGGTESGQTAKFYLANCYYNLRDFDNALKYFEDYSGKNNIIKASCLSGIGSVYEAKGDIQKGAEYYEKSANLDKTIIINQENIYYAIRAYDQAGNKKEAKRLYETLKNDYPTSKYIAEIKKIESNFNN
jgi:tetratricopeptide (TPR) repeat protein